MSSVSDMPRNERRPEHLPSDPSKNENRESVLVRVLQRNKINRRNRKIYYKELACAIMEAGKSKNLQGRGQAGDPGALRLRCKSRGYLSGALRRADVPVLV